MAQIHSHILHHSADFSPFVPLAAAQLGIQRMDFAAVAPGGRADQAARQPSGDSMQVDSSGAAAAAAASSANRSAAAASSEAGPSGVVPPGGDSSMAVEQQRKKPRKHSDAPMRKLSVSLIDTYKLINQVRLTFLFLHAVAPAALRVRRRGARAAAERTCVSGRART